jgi:hypothetical protein
VKHDEPSKPGGDKPVLDRPAGPAGTGPQERRKDLLPADLPPGAVHYEATDVNVWPVTKALGALVAVTVVALLIPMFLWFRGRLARTDPAPPPMGRHETGRLPAEPRLQTRPLDDLAAIRADDERRLKSYGWVDESQGIVRIPIEAAMRMIAERGLPAPAAAPSAAPSGAPGAAPSALPAAAAPAGGAR